MRLPSQTAPLHWDTAERKTGTGSCLVTRHTVTGKGEGSLDTPGVACT